MSDSSAKEQKDTTGFKDFSERKNGLFVFLCLLLIAAITLAYSNHFQNDFHFDDSHTIVENNAIKEVNATAFFTDASTFSTLASNQSYRPLTTLENAVDYKLGGGLEPFGFHLHIFITFLLTCAVLCFFVKKLLDHHNHSRHNKFYGLLVAAIFGLLCANAETVNYIIQRGEIVSGLFVLLGFATFLVGGFWKKFHLYLLFPLIGFFSKEMALVFAPLLFLYFLIFEEDADLLKFYKPTEFKKCFRSLLKTGPALLLTIAFYIFYSNMRPETFYPGGVDNFKYLITQPAVMMHYLATFFVPYNLSADSDWTVFESLTDYRAILGIIGVLAIAYLALRAARNKKTKLFSFGVLWFFIALLPTSSFIAFSEVLNDHRSFIPYMGISIAFVFGTKYLLEKYLSKSLAKKSTQHMLALVGICFLAANAYGVFQRNKVWKTDLSLWHDVTVKSPGNSRGHMNYGLALMESGDYDNAEIYFNKSLEKLPNYATLQINMAILQNAKGNKTEAESRFKKALAINENLHSSWFFYGRFLFEEWRFGEAIKSYSKVLELSPNYRNTKEMLMKCYHHTGNWEELQKLAGSILNADPNNAMAKSYMEISLTKKSIFSELEAEIAKAPTAEKYLDLSLKYFKSKKFEDCISAAEKALQIRPEYAEAYNNIGIANYYLKNYERAIQAYQTALKLKPNYALAQNNLKKANEAFESGGIQGESANTQKANELINLSLQYYNEGKFQACIDTARESIGFKPTAAAYNNICSAYNELKLYEKAIIACRQSLQLEPDHKLARGNLDYALKKKSSE